MAKDIDRNTLDRVIKFFPMLSSDQSGDVVNAAAAITRVLKAAGNDWHDLAARIEAGKPTVTVSIDDLERERARRDRTHADFGEDFWARMRRNAAAAGGMNDFGNPQAQRDAFSRGFGGRKSKADRVDEMASRNSREHRAKKQGTASREGGGRVAVDRADLMDVIKGIEGALGGPGSLDELGEQAFSFLTGLQEKASRYDTVRLTIRQDLWLRSLARQQHIDVPWPPAESA